jgi:predicted MFS family arabinose efflux permease
MTYETILSLAWFFAGSFSLVFLIREGLTVQHAAYFVMLGYLAVTVFLIIFSRTGFPRAHISMAIGNLIMAAHFACYLLLSGALLINIAPVLLALYIPFFWIPFNVAMIGLTTAKNRGLIISLTFVVFPIVYFIGPLVGGVTIENLGYDVVFLAALVLFVMNAGLIVTTWRKHGASYSPKLDPSGLWKFPSSGFLFEGVQEGVFVVAVPLATFFLVGGEFDLGKMLAVFGLAGGVMSVVAGKLSDRKGNRTFYIMLAVLVCGPLLILSAFVKDPLLFGLTIGAIYFFLPLFWIFLFALSIDRAASSQNAIMGRELMLNVGRTLGASLCLVATLFMNVQSTFVIAGIALLLVPLLALRRSTTATAGQEEEAPGIRD